MSSPMDDWKEAAFAAFVANQARQNASEQRRRFERGEFTLELVAGEDDPPPRDPAFQRDLSRFGAALHDARVDYTQRALALDSAQAHGYPLPEFILALKVLAPSAIGAIGVAVGAWIQARSGRKARLKIGDVEAEGRSSEEVSALLEMAKAYRGPGSATFAQPQPAAEIGPSSGEASRATRIILIRHAEKTGVPGDRALSTEGRQRAQALAVGLPRKFGPIDAIFAAAASKKSDRPVETVQPLAAALDLEIDGRWGTWDYKDLAQHVLSADELRGRTILICWRHDALQPLAQALGAGDAGPWPEDLYDRIWLLTRSDSTTRLEDSPSF